MLTKLVDYEYYSKNYGGSSIPESSFQKSVIEASSKINQYTSNRINETILDDNIRNTACEIVELIYSQSILKEKIISDDKSKASETVGPHSVTYVNNKTFQEKEILTPEELEYNCYKICYRYLVNTGLMYRGVFNV